MGILDSRPDHNRYRSMSTTQHQVRSRLPTPVPHYPGGVGCSPLAQRHGMVRIELTWAYSSLMYRTIYVSDYQYEGGAGVGSLGCSSIVSTPPNPLTSLSLSPSTDRHCQTQASQTHHTLHAMAHDTTNDRRHGPRDRKGSAATNGHGLLDEGR